MLEIDIKWIKFSFLAVLIVFSLSVGFKAEAFPPEDVFISAPPATIGNPSSVTVTSEHAVGLVASWCVEIDFGDGSPKENGSCSPGPMEIRCNVNFSHTYANTGSYSISAVSCNCGRPGDPGSCRLASATANVNSPGAPIPPTPGATASGTQDEINPLRYNTFGELFDRVVGVIFWIAAIVGPLFIIIGGFMMLFAGANPSNIALGKKVILYTAVIFGIILIIKALTYYFRGDLTFS